MKRLSNASQHKLRRLFWFLLVVNLLFIVGSRYYLQPLTSKEIVAFELAREVPVAQELINNWQTTELLEKARWSIYIDFVFIILYTIGLAVAGMFIARLTQHEILIRSSKFLSYLLIIAGVCDVIENVSLLKSLNGEVTNWNVVLAYDMATTKFSILILAILFIAVCLVFWFFRKVSAR